ncbi:hypothetical protein K474DRAFT_1665048 [Panus rudis PR-1116 ss-1]|nr:hypothetical protein K474DRAFT_1665048 [Panus rudis PR-1116 ss-1]
MSTPSVLERSLTASTTSAVPNTSTVPFISHHSESTCNNGASLIPSSCRELGLVSAINRILPNELLSIIFAVSVRRPSREYKEEKYTALTISGVCGKWRSVALNTQECWAVIDITLPAFSLLALSRVSNGLRVFWDTGEAYTDGIFRREIKSSIPMHLLSELSSRASQISALEISADMSRIRSEVLSLLSSATHLSELSLANATSPGLQLDETELNGGTQHGTQYCSLRHVCLHGILPAWTSPLLSNPLTTLDLSNDNHSITPLGVNALLTILMKSRGLQHLRLQHIPFTSTHDYRAPASIASLPNLGELKLVFQHEQLRHVVNVLSRISFSLTTRVQIRGIWYGLTPMQALQGGLPQLVACPSIIALVQSSRAASLIVGRNPIIAEYWDKLDLSSESTPEPNLSIRFSFESRSDVRNVVELLAKIACAANLPLSELKSLYLGINHNSSEQNRSNPQRAAWDQLADTISRCCSLETLSLESKLTPPLLTLFIDSLHRALSSRFPNSSRTTYKLRRLRLIGDISTSSYQSEETFYSRVALLQRKLPLLEEIHLYRQKYMNERTAVPHRQLTGQPRPVHFIFTDFNKEVFVSM